MQINPTYIHLIDLDALLDARLGAVSHFWGKHALKLLQEGWQDRTTDRVIWENAPFTEHQYKERLYRGYKETLMSSGPTMLTEYIKDTVRELLQSPEIGVSDQTHEFVLNTHPYELNPSELEELRGVLLEHFPFAVSVKTVCVGQNAVTPLYLKDKAVTHYYTYHLTGWIKKHEKALHDCPIPQITIIGPALMEHSFDEFEDAEELKALSEKLSPFEAVGMSLCVFVNIAFIDARWFSLLPKPTKQHNGGT